VRTYYVLVKLIFLINVHLFRFHALFVHPFIKGCSFVYLLPLCFVIKIATFVQIRHGCW